MAAAVRTTAAGGGSTGTSNRTVTIVPAANDLFIVFVVVAANAQDAPTMTDDNGSGTYTRITTQAFASSVPTNYRLSAFVRTALVPNTTSTVITATTGSNTAGELICYAISGMTKTGISALQQSAGQAAGGSGTTPAPAFASACDTTHLVLGAMANSSTSPIETQPSGWSEEQDTGQSSPTTSIETVSNASGFTGTTVTWGATSGTQFASIIVELDAANPPATPASRLRMVGHGT